MRKRLMTMLQSSDRDVFGESALRPFWQPLLPSAPAAVILRLRPPPRATDALGRGERLRT
jgi:hypothetical protein